MLALLITVGLWWTYFNRSAAAAAARLASNDDPVLAAADGYSYLHLALVAGIIIFAVGAKSAVAQGASPLSAAARLALCGGVALYLIGHAAFRLRLAAAFSVATVCAAGACVAVVAITAGRPASATSGAVALVLALLVARETLSERAGARPTGAPA